MVRKVMSPPKLAHPKVVFRLIGHGPSLLAADGSRNEVIRPPRSRLKAVMSGLRLSAAGAQFVSCGHRYRTGASPIERLPHPPRLSRPQLLILSEGVDRRVPRHDGGRRCPADPILSSVAYRDGSLSDFDSYIHGLI